MSGPRAWLHSGGRLHAWYHVALFLILGLLAMRASPRLSMRLCWLIVAVMLGFAMECAEAICYGSLMEWTDVWTDALGVVLGAAMGWLLSRRRAGSS
jgi:glycopeptide antibiotics resistance protein